MVHHFQQRIYWPKLMAEGFRRLKLAPLITKAIRFRRYHLKNQGLCGLLINKLQIEQDRNSAYRECKMAEKVFVRKFFMRLKVNLVQRRQKSSLAASKYVTHLLRAVIMNLRSSVGRSVSDAMSKAEEFRQKSLRR